MKNSSVLRSAWLITWESYDDQGRVPHDKRIVAVLNYRWTGQRVREFIEQLHASLKYSTSEKIRVARDANNNPYPAKFGEVNGGPWLDEVLCGHNPWLKARKVKNLRVAEGGELGVGGLLWEEVSRHRKHRASPE